MTLQGLQGSKNLRSFQDRSNNRDTRKPIVGVMQINRKGDGGATLVSNHCELRRQEKRRGEKADGEGKKGTGVVLIFLGVRL